MGVLALLYLLVFGSLGLGLGLQAWWWQGAVQALQVRHRQPQPALLDWLMAGLARLGLSGAPGWTGRLWALWHGALAVLSLALIAPWAWRSLAALVLAGLVLALWWAPLRALWRALARRR